MSTETDRQRLGTLQSLVAHPGWAAFHEHAWGLLSAERMKALGAGTDRDARAEHAAAYRALDVALDWPERQIEQLYARLNKGD